MKITVSIFYFIVTLNDVLNGAFNIIIFFYYIKGEISGNNISDGPDMLPLASSHLASSLLQHIEKAGFNITAHSECRNLFKLLKEPV